MFRSLRFRLPALFLLAILLAGLLSTAIALQLFRDWGQSQTRDELRREASGLAQLYADAALRAADEGATAPDFAAEKIELATGDRIFYAGASVFPGQESGLQRVPVASLPPEARSLDVPLVFEFTPPGEDELFVAAAEPVRLEPETDPFGMIIVGTPKSDISGPWTPLLTRLAIAFAVGAVFAGLLSWWLSRRITIPVLALSRAADQIAAGDYAIAVPPSRGQDEISHLTERFGDMAARLAATEERERQFLMSVSHELRTPLTAIHGHVDAIRDGLVEDPTLVRESLDVVSAEATRLERLVGDVLDLAKLRAHRFTVQAEEVDMTRLVEHAYGAFGDEARRREIDYRLVEQGDPPTIVTDGDRVLQVITNLLTNAFRWTPDGGAIELAMRAANGTVSVVVSDNGPGIGPDELERIFRPFVSSDTQGTGLGLPIARELAAALGGSVEVQSELGSGSSFGFVLPVRSA
jgi:two-component system sensor histidine kinase BaeS